MIPLLEPMERYLAIHLASMAGFIVQRSADRGIPPG